MSSPANGEFLVRKDDLHKTEWFDLPVEAVEAARAYYQEHKALIDNRIDPYGEL